MSIETKFMQELGTYTDSIGDLLKTNIVTASQRNNATLSDPTLRALFMIIDQTLSQALTNNTRSIQTLLHKIA